MLSTRRSRTATLPVAFSASVVASNSDLLIQILFLLPAKSLIRFKLVSKHWLSLITDPYFSDRHSKISNPIPRGIFLRHSLLLFNPQDNISGYLISVRNPKHPFFMAFSFVPNPSEVRILHSCNGLLLFHLYCPEERELSYFIFNPTTKQFTSLPKLSGSGSFGMTLAFDPSKSQNYKVICVRTANGRTLESIDDSSCSFIIEIYSSQAGPWRVSGEPFTAHVNVEFGSGVFWNGSVHWVNMWGDSLYFNVDQERLQTLPMPRLSDGQVEQGEGRRIRYFGESMGHLNLIEIYDSPISKFNVYELKTDYSEWFVKYNVDLGPVSSVVRDLVLVEDVVLTYSEPSECDYYNVGVLAVVRGGEKEEDSFLVLHISGKVVRYDIVDGTFTKLCDLGSLEDDNGQLQDTLRGGGWFCPCPFIESLSCV